MSATPTVLLRPVVRFREFPFGTRDDPSMRAFTTEQPWENQDKVLAYLRSGVVLSATMGANLTDWLDRSHKANPVIDGQTEGGATEMTDGEWFWYAGLIYFVEKYNVRLPEAFVEHARRHGWRVDRSAVLPVRYDFTYFEKAAPER